MYTPVAVDNPSSTLAEPLPAPAGGLPILPGGGADILETTSWVIAGVTGSVVFVDDVGVAVEVQAASSRAAVTSRHIMFRVVLIFSPCFEAID